MALDRQLEQLCNLYAEKSDDELLALHEQHEDLTDLAQQALEQVMAERKLAPRSVVFNQLAEVEDEDASNAPLAADEVSVMTFHDAFLATEAIRNLKLAAIEHRVVDFNVLAPRDGASGMRLGLIVKKADEARARQLLQQAMNLYPTAEGTDSFDDLDGFRLVGHFERKDALRVAHALGSEGVSYIWTDDREDPQAESDDVQIEVNAPHLEHAQQLAHQALANSSD